MRKIAIIFMFFALLGFTLNAQNQSEEKEIDKTNYSVANKADFVNVVIDNSSPTFERRFSNGYSAGCDKTSSLSGVKFYDVIPFYSTSAEALDISATSVSGTDDMHFTVYCDPFDPMMTANNIIAIDDDDGPSWMPAFLPSDNYMIEANTQYFLVIAPFSGGDTGSADISFGGDFTIGTVAAPPAVPISNWAFALIGLLAIGFVFIKFRK